MPSIVIIGAGLAGWSVAKEIRKLDPDIPVTLITADAGDFYAKPAISNAFAQGKTAATLVTTPASMMAAKYQVELLAHCHITAIDQANRQVISDRGPLAYRQLVLALGASPIRLPLDGDAADQVLSINHLADYAVFRQTVAAIQHRQRPRIALLGGGLIGAEFANDLAPAHDVSLFDPAPGPVAALLPEATRNALLNQLQAVGIQTHFGRSVKAINRRDEDFLLTLDDGTESSADVVLSAIGLRPQIALAAAAGLATERGIQVDATLATSDPDIFALGDCAQYIDGPLPYVAPILHAARALASSLASSLVGRTVGGGHDGRVHFPPMPVTLKTPVYPVVILPPPRQAAGQWVTEENAEETAGLSQRFISEDGRWIGFALSGSRTKKQREWLEAFTAQQRDKPAV